MTELEEALARARTEVPVTATLDDLEALQRDLVGRGSPAQRANEQIKNLAADERPAAGKALGAFRAEVEALVNARRDELAIRRGQAQSNGSDSTSRWAGASIDADTASRSRRSGESSRTSSPGSATRSGRPEVEDDWHNFEALNFPPGHPARAMQDTLYVRLGDARAGDAAYAHVAHADPADGDGNRRRSTPSLPGRMYPPRHAGRPPLAGVPPDRGARRRPRHHAWAT